VGIERNIIKAANFYKSALQNGSLEAYCALARLDTQGAPGYPKNYSEAYSCYQFAANKGSAEGQNGLGILYANGWGVPRDYGIARLSFNEAAEKGCTEAQSNLGNLYYHGQGVQKNPDKAAHWYLKARAEEKGLREGIRIVPQGGGPGPRVGAI
jgi:uncharacterized protein